MDQLEKYIRTHQEELDKVESVDADGLWDSIQARKSAVHRLPNKPTSGWQFKIGRNWRWSAAAAVVLIVGITAWFRLPPTPSNQLTATTLSIKDYYPELAEEEMNFRRTIAQKEAELVIGKLDRQQFLDVFNELDELEVIHRQQLQDLPEVFDNEEWVRTLMRYYEQKIRILERLSREIDKRERQEGRSI